MVAAAVYTQRFSGLIFHPQIYRKDEFFKPDLLKNVPLLSGSLVFSTICIAESEKLKVKKIIISGNNITKDGNNIFQSLETSIIKRGRNPMYMRKMTGFTRSKSYVYDTRSLY